MRTPGRGWIVALICLSNFWGASFALAQQSDHVMAERVLGAQWKQLSRRAGMIFAGTVLGSTPPATAIDRAAPASILAVQLRFRVDEPIAGVKRGQVVTIHEWVGALDRQRPMIKGQHVLILLYPPSRMGLTSPVGGSLGQITLDANGKNVVERKAAAATELRDASFPRSHATAADAIVTVLQLERAIRNARSEEE
jgi:hypothetical protein